MGVYYPLGGAMCRIVNATRKEHKLRCSVEPTEGRCANIKGVLAGDFDLGFAQSDTQYSRAERRGSVQGQAAAEVARAVHASIRNCSR